MDQLNQEKCIACRGDSPGLTDQEIGQLHRQINEWDLIDDCGIRKVERALRFRNFAEALAFTNALGNMAEDEGHHPRVVTEWGGVAVIWWTHKIRGLHRNDFIMAAKTDQLYHEFLKTQQP
jgi:4a-hydroxytetrahydrobiopterin dehydratase